MFLLLPTVLIPLHCRIGLVGGEGRCHCRASLVPNELQ